MVEPCQRERSADDAAQQPAPASAERLFAAINPKLTTRDLPCRRSNVRFAAVAAATKAGQLRMIAPDEDGQIQAAGEPEGDERVRRDRQPASQLGACRSTPRRTRGQTSGREAQVSDCDPDFFWPCLLSLSVRTSIILSRHEPAARHRHIVGRAAILRPEATRCGSFADRRSI